MLGLATWTPNVSGDVYSCMLGFFLTQPDSYWVGSIVLVSCNVGGCASRLQDDMWLQLLSGEIANKITPAMGLYYSYRGVILDNGGRRSRYLLVANLFFVAEASAFEVGGVAAAQA